MLFAESASGQVTCGKKIRIWIIHAAHDAKQFVYSYEGNMGCHSQMPRLNELMDCSITETELRLLDTVKYEITFNSTESAYLVCNIPK